jgi:hypothetical protein
MASDGHALAQIGSTQCWQFTAEQRSAAFSASNRIRMRDWPTSIRPQCHTAQAISQ